MRAIGGGPMRRLAKGAMLAVSLAPLCLAAGATATYACAGPAEIGDGWAIASAAEAGFDEALLCALQERVSGKNDLNVHGIVVVRRGELAFESYGSGVWTPWGQPLGLYSYDAATPHDVRSISKSVVSLLVGIAIDRGLIGVDDVALDHLPQYAELRTPEKERIRVGDLLTMTSGLDWMEMVPYADARNTERLMAESADPYRYVLEREVVTAPGATWYYNGGSTMLLSAILQHATGQPLVTFAEEALFAPLGISDFEWIGLRASGEPAAYGSLRMRPRDLAKIGQLVLDRGRWNGRQVVSEAWISESTAGRFDADPPDRYGYQWWVGTSPGTGDGAPLDWIAGYGIGGQRLFIVPALDLVVAMTAGLPWESNQRAVMLGLLEDEVLPAIAR